MKQIVLAFLALLGLIAQPAGAQTRIDGAPTQHVRHLADVPGPAKAAQTRSTAQHAGWQRSGLPEAQILPILFDVVQVYPGSAALVGIDRARE